MVLHQKTWMITKSEYLWKWNSAVYDKKAECIDIGSERKGSFGRNINEQYMKLMVSTSVHTPFKGLYSNPTFHLIFDHQTWAPHSWVDVMISAKSNQKSEINKSGNCLDFYRLLRESISISRTGSHELNIQREKIYSMLLNLKQHSQKEAVKFKIKISTRRKLYKTKYKTILRLKWASQVELSQDFLKKAISLPGYIIYIIIDTLNFMRNYTINLHWIPNMLNGSSFKPSDVNLCKKDLLPTTVYTYCLNYTSVHKSYIFFWKIFWYLEYYEVKNPYTYENHKYILKKSETYNKKTQKVAKSWTEASKLCRLIGGFLPLIRNRDELDEIITFLKSSDDMPPVEALLIGLRRVSEFQVDFFMLLWLCKCKTFLVLM